MSKYIVWVRQGNCIQRGNDWFQDTWYDYKPEWYHEYSTYEEARKAFENIDLTRYHLPSKKRFVYKEIVEPKYDDEGEEVDSQVIDYEERFFKDWIDG